MRYVRKSRVNRVDGSVIVGPVHFLDDVGWGSLTYCGVRLKGFGVTHSSEPLEGRTCLRCEANRLTGRRDSWKSR